MDKLEYFVMWREDYNDEEGWFTKDQAEALVNRIWTIEAEEQNGGYGGEPEIYFIIKGEDVTNQFGDVESYENTRSSSQT